MATIDILNSDGYLTIPPLSRYEHDLLGFYQDPWSRRTERDQRMAGTGFIRYRKKHVMRLPPWSKALESVELQIGMYEHMEKQQVNRFNWRHGSAFLAANIRVAVSYGTKSYGSELIRETFTLLDLLDEEAPGRSEDLLENYPEVAELRPISSYPLLIRLDRVPVSELKDEHGGDPNGMIEWASSIDSEIFRPFSQALNFELVTPVPSSRLCAFRVVNCTNEYFDGAPEEFELDPID